MVEILYKTSDIVIITKPYGMPSEPDPSGDKDALTATSEILTSLGERGCVYPVHRLDRVVGGVMMIARNKRSAAALSQLVQERMPKKEYLAVVEGVPTEGVYEDLILKDARRGMAVILDKPDRGSKPCSLSLSVISTVSTERGEKSLVYLSLGTGRFHQIRAQLSSRKHPIVGDGKYGSHDKSKSGIALFSCRLSVPTSGRAIDVTALPATSDYPWSLFEKYIKKDIFI